MAYTVEIVAGSTYTFDVTRVPEWAVKVELEHDDSKYPSLPIRETATVTLRGCSYRSATPSSVSSDWASIRAHLSSRTAPVTSVALKSGGSAIETVGTSTHDQIMVVSLDPEPSHGHMATHWLGTIVFKATRWLADNDGLVRKNRRLTYAPNAYGHETHTLEVEVWTAPGTSAEALVRAEALELPGAKWRYLTNGDEGMEVELAEDSEDTQARGRCVIEEQAIAYPSGANEYNLTVRTRESGEKKEVEYQVTAQADTLARALAIARGSPAPSVYTEKETVEERHLNRVTTTFSVRDVERKPRTTSWTVRSSGGGGEVEAMRFPSIGRRLRPVPWRRPADAYVFVESVTVEATGDARPPVPSCFRDQGSLDTSTSEDEVALVTSGSTPSQNVYSRRVTRTHTFFGAPPTPEQLLAAMLAQNPAASGSRSFAYEIAEASRG